jgi:hypothetical protein
LKNGIKEPKVVFVDVKTFPPYKIYPNLTGITKKNYLEYSLLDPSFTLLFVDELNGKIYGDTLYNLKTNYDQNIKDNHVAGTGERISWDITKMKTLSELFDIIEDESYLTNEEIDNFKILDSWKDRNKQCKEYKEFVYKLFEGNRTYLGMLF